MMRMPDPLVAEVMDARERTLALASALTPEQLLGPRLPIVNPPLWELGHVGWFQEKWNLRRIGRPALRTDGDSLYDSIAIPHDARWSLPLPGLDETLDDLREIGARVVTLLERGEADPYFVRLGVLHEDMHLEAMAFTRQTLGLGPPWPDLDGPLDGGGDLTGDVEVPGGTFQLGAARAAGFVFDNEKWAHPVELAAFRIARAPVTQARFAEFVGDGGYRRRELWSEAGWRWREAAGADRPVYWDDAGGRGWRRRHFDRWLPLEPDRPMVHVCWFEAEAWCRWAGRRLPTEAEWEAAAAGERGRDGLLAARKRRYPWGDEPPTDERARLGARALHPADVGALPDGDSAFGCRQLLGNVWEWTATDFLPYPGFVADPYREYSQPWFGTHKVLRGGSFATPARLIRNTWRNFYTPDRRDPWAGFRTCAP